MGLLLLNVITVMASLRTMCSYYTKLSKGLANIIGLDWYVYSF